MAGESSNPLVIPKKIEPVPRYLRASTGSCHDLCKYGRKHAFEEKPWKPVRRRTTKPSLNELTPVEIVVSGEQKGEKLVKHRPSTDIKDSSLYQKPSADTKSYSPKPKTSLNAKSYSSPRQNVSSGKVTRLLKCKPSPIKKSPSPDPPEIIKREIVLPSTKVEVPMQQGSSISNKMSRTEKKTDYQSEKSLSSVKSKPLKVKPLSSSDNSDGIHGMGRRNGDVKTSRKITAFKANAKKALVPAPAPLPPKLSLSKRSFTKTRKAGNFKKLVSPLKDQNRVWNVETVISHSENVSERTLHVIRTGTESDALESISADYAIPSLPSTTSPKSLSHANPPSMLFHEKDDEETDYGGVETEKFVCSDYESMENGKDESGTKNHHTLIKNRVVVSENKSRSPVKLKFRIGKAMDIQSDHNNPKKLRFRKGRVLGTEKGKADLKKKTFKNAGGNDDASDAALLNPKKLRFRKGRVLGTEKGKADLKKKVFKNAGGNDDATDAAVSSQKVVLKHQVVQGKKDARGLFNNVIEETASKLVQSRKSKVKALVGAFETVISLQENKPALPNFG